MWIHTNEKPVIRGANDAIWRRIKLIPFIHPIPPEKRKRRDVVDDALKAEAEGILAWLVQGARIWYQQGLQLPEEVTGAVDSYRSEMDYIQQFFDECIIAGPSESRQSVYQAFTAWCRENGIKYVMSAASFGRRFSKKLVVDQPREKQNGQYVWHGISLTESAKFLIY